MLHTNHEPSGLYLPPSPIPLLSFPLLPRSGKGEERRGKAGYAQVMPNLISPVMPLINYLLQKSSFRIAVNMQHIKKTMIATMITCNFSMLYLYDLGVRLTSCSCLYSKVFYNKNIGYLQEILYSIFLDTFRNTCESPMESWDQHANWTYNRFTEGSIVWAKLDGYPWWPGMIEVDPDMQAFVFCFEHSYYTPVSFSRLHFLIVN